MPGESLVASIFSFDARYKRIKERVPLVKRLFSVISENRTRLSACRSDLRKVSIGDPRQNAEFVRPMSDFRERVMFWKNN